MGQLIGNQADVYVGLCTILIASVGIYVQDPERVVEGFTEEFEEGFMELLRRSHPHSRVAAKIVYNDYISDACVPSPLAISSLGVSNTN